MSAIATRQPSMARLSPPDAEMEFAAPAAEPAPEPFPSDPLARLKLLRKAVAERPEVAFDMEAWARRDACGTSYCAAGSYIHANPGCGLTLIFNADGFAAIGLNGKEADHPKDVLAGHFGISYQDAERLFDPSEYSESDRDAELDVLKSAVLARIDATIAAKEAERNAAPAPEAFIAAERSVGD